MRILLLSSAIMVLLLGATLSAYAQAEVTLIAPGGIRAPLEQLIPGLRKQDRNK